MKDTQRCFCPVYSTADHEKSWEYAKNAYTCFVDLEKQYGLVSREKLSGVLWSSSLTRGKGGHLPLDATSGVYQVEVGLLCNNYEMRNFNDATKYDLQNVDCWRLPPTCEISSR